eukprot:m51a1_g5434 hypothetical protein (197) ;mRNA; r:163281-164288
MSSQLSMYSADQIKVFDGLTDILKDYAKAVIRAAPEDILVFSQQYFEGKAKEAQAAKPLTKERLIELREKVGAGPISRDKLSGMCTAVGFDAESLARLLKDPVEAEEFVALACALLAEGFVGAVGILLDVFSGRIGGSVEVPKFVRLVKFLSARDSRIPESLVDKFAQHFESKGIKDVTFLDFSNSPLLSQLPQFR